MTVIDTNTGTHLSRLRSKSSYENKKTAERKSWSDIPYPYAD